MKNVFSHSFTEDETCREYTVRNFSSVAVHPRIFEYYSQFVGVPILKNKYTHNYNLNNFCFENDIASIYRQERFQLLYYLRVYPTVSQCGFLFGNKTSYSSMIII